MKKVFIITGEYSGDIHGSKVAGLIREQLPDVEIHGIGGENLKNAERNVINSRFKRETGIKSS